MSQPLDLLSFPLHGSRLIEASAGTGKTFTLALLYIRLVLGHGGDGRAFARPLMPPEILVVTFTDAATKELRDRIRQRLVEAAVCFEAPPERTDDDPLLDLRATYPVERWPACARQLRLAADWMDEAVISTIHGWCNRMLQEHAFDTRGLFDRELVTDQSDLVAEVVRDYWRLHFYPLPPELARGVVDVAGSPEGLEATLKDWLRRRDLRLSYKGAPMPADPFDEPLRQHCAWLAAKDQAEAESAALQVRNTELEQRARDAWRAGRASLEARLRDLRQHLMGRSYDSTQEDTFDALLTAMARWSEGGAAPSKLKNFAQGAFKLKKTAKLPEPSHPAFQAIAAWQAATAGTPAALEPPEPAFPAVLLAHAADWIGHELERRLAQRAEMGFDDLLRQLDAALAPSAGEHAARLRETIRRQFPVALIDEFQDTDPIQYRIFDRIYDVVRSDSDTALVMIGDPKQAIYSFRGADIHAYLAARQATEGRHYSLAKNFRATQALVAGCNRLFAHAEGQGRGAFRFKSGERNPIPFEAVAAKGRAERLLLDGRETSAITLWTLEAEEAALAETAYRDQMAEVAATQVACWLSAAREDRAGFRHPERFERLRPKDIAILVRSITEAVPIRAALSARGIASVYLSDRDSVLESQEASDLLHWLRACAAPTEEPLVRAALGTNTLAVALDEVWRLFNDELEWELQVERFREYRAIWQRQGVLAMLRRLMQDAELPRRLLARDGGERRLTNLLHLAEWLQQAATGIDGEQALIRHLAEHIGEIGEEHILRLESDAELVQVITIHKSKGLEYPLVLLPFICSWREVDGHTKQVPYRAEGRRFLEIAGKKGFPAAWEAADDERLSEDMRLLYVALTRAQHGLWLGVGPLKKGQAKKIQLEKSAMGHVLGGGRPFASAAELWAALGVLKADSADIRIEPAPEPSAQRLAPETDGALDAARPPPDLKLTPWWITSYSALSRHTLPSDGTASRSAPDSAETAVQETALEETAVARPVSEPAPRYPDKHLHAFPRGSRYGTFLHGILEWAATPVVESLDGRRLQGFAAAAHSRAARREVLGQRCNLRRLTPWIEPLDAWLADLLNREWVLHDLADPGAAPPRLTLRDLAPHQIQVEMEFWLESRGVDIGAVDRLVQRQVQPGHPRPQLGGLQINGMLKGFIDLVFEHQGRYYLVDWKSNWLGPDDGAYGQEAMREAMLHARYELQYVLYLLALHRQLKARLPGYDYDRHIGGAIYVFLRGGYAESQGLYMDKPVHGLIESLDTLFYGASAAAVEESR